MGPGAVGGATWMWAANTGATPLTVIVQHTLPRPGLTLSVAVPIPSGSPWLGTPWALTSAAPVSVTVKGRPPWADAGDPPATSAIATANTTRTTRRIRGNTGASSPRGSEYLR